MAKSIATSNPRRKPREPTFKKEMGASLSTAQMRGVIVVGFIMALRCYFQWLFLNPLHPPPPPQTCCIHPSYSPSDLGQTFRPEEADASSIQQTSTSRATPNSNLHSLEVQAQPSHPEILNGRMIRPHNSLLFLELLSVLSGKPSITLPLLFLSLLFFYLGICKLLLLLKSCFYKSTYG